MKMISRRNKMWWTFWLNKGFVDNGNEVLIIDKLETLFKKSKYLPRKISCILNV